MTAALPEEIVGRNGCPGRMRVFYLRPSSLRQGLAEGKTTREIAIASGCSAKTAQTHRGNFMQKLHLHSTSEVVLYAIRNQLIPTNSHAA